MHLVIYETPSQQTDEVSVLRTMEVEVNFGGLWLPHPIVALVFTRYLLLHHTFEFRRIQRSPLENHQLPGLPLGGTVGAAGFQTL